MVVPTTSEVAIKPVMHERNRDVLVLSQAAQHNPRLLERELVCLDAILFDTENWTAFGTANEIIDVNRHKIIRKPYLIQQVLSEKRIKPFVFTSNKN